MEYASSEDKEQPSIRCPHEGNPYDNLLYINGEKGRQSSCADAQAGLGPHNPYGTEMHLSILQIQYKYLFILVIHI